MMDKERLKFWGFAALSLIGIFASYYGSYADNQSIMWFGFLLFNVPFWAGVIYFALIRRDHIEQGEGTA